GTRGLLFAASDLACGLLRSRWVAADYCDLHHPVRPGERYCPRRYCGPHADHCRISAVAVLPEPRHRREMAGHWPVHGWAGSALEHRLLALLGRAAVCGFVGGDVLSRYAADEPLF